MSAMELLSYMREPLSGKFLQALMKYLIFVNEMHALYGKNEVEVDVEGPDLVDTIHWDVLALPELKGIAPKNLIPRKQT